MNRRFNLHLFWGSHSPLSTLGGAALILMASNRFAIAIICAGALVWVYGLTALIFSSASPIMPIRGRNVILLFLSAFICGIFGFLMGLLNPLLILETTFFFVLIPPCCLGSGFFETSELLDPFEVFSRAVLEALIIAGIILAFALIREPLGMGTISFPWGTQGTVELFERKEDAFVPARILSVSAGGLLLLGYGTAIFRYFREKSGNAPRNDELPEVKP